MPKIKTSVRQKVARTRNSGTMTEAAFWGYVRSSLRKSFMYWKPGQLALKNAKVGTGKGARWLCASCHKLFLRKDVQADHIVPAGRLLDFQDISCFVERLLVESEGFQCLCKECHATKTQDEKGKKS